MKIKIIYSERIVPLPDGERCAFLDAKGETIETVRKADIIDVNGHKPTW